MTAEQIIPPITDPHGKYETNGFYVGMMLPITQNTWKLNQDKF